jgi:hypothetical protein
VGLIFIWKRNFTKNLVFGVKFKTKLDAYITGVCSSLLVGNLLNVLPQLTEEPLRMNILKAACCLRKFSVDVVPQPTE